MLNSPEKGYMDEATKQTSDQLKKIDVNADEKFDDVDYKNLGESVNGLKMQKEIFDRKIKTLKEAVIAYAQAEGIENIQTHLSTMGAVKLVNRSQELVNEMEIFMIGLESSEDISDPDPNESSSNVPKTQSQGGGLDIGGSPSNENSPQRDTPRNQGGGGVVFGNQPGVIQDGVQFTIGSNKSDEDKSDSYDGGKSSDSTETVSYGATVATTNKKGIQFYAGGTVENTSKDTNSASRSIDSTNRGLVQSNSTSLINEKSDGTKTKNTTAVFGINTANSEKKIAQRKASDVITNHKADNIVEEREAEQEMKLHIQKGKQQNEYLKISPKLKAILGKYEVALSKEGYEVTLEERNQIFEHIDSFDTSIVSLGTKKTDKKALINIKNKLRKLNLLKSSNNNQKEKK